MNMKKIIAILLMIISLSSTVFATNTNRWYWISSNRDFSTYVDIRTLSYNADTDTADLYIKRVYPEDNKTVTQHVLINFTTNKIISTAYYVFHGDSTNVYENTTSHTENIVPDTLGEVMRDKVNALVGRDAKQAYIKDIKANPGHIAY